jgi:hypothetical protein
MVFSPTHTENNYTKCLELFIFNIEHYEKQTSPYHIDQ